MGSSFHTLWNVLKPQLFPFLRAQRCLNGRPHMGVSIAIELTTNSWMEETAFHKDTIPLGVRETIKLWTQREATSKLFVGRISWDGDEERGGGGRGKQSKETTKGFSRLLSLSRAYSALALCARGAQSTELWDQCVNPYPLPSLITSPGQLNASQDFCLQLETNEWGESMQPPEQPK